MRPISRVFWIVMTMSVLVTQNAATTAMNASRMNIIIFSVRSALKSIASSSCHVETA